MDKSAILFAQDLRGDPDYRSLCPTDRGVLPGLLFLALADGHASLPARIVNPQRAENLNRSGPCSWPAVRARLLRAGFLQPGENGDEVVLYHPRNLIQITRDGTKVEGVWLGPRPPEDPTENDGGDQ